LNKLFQCMSLAYRWVPPFLRRSRMTFRILLTDNYANMTWDDPVEGALLL
jgi:hypothetical protein